MMKRGDGCQYDPRYYESSVKRAKGSGGLAASDGFGGISVQSRQPGMLGMEPPNPNPHQLAAHAHSVAAAAAAAAVGGGTGPATASTAAAASQARNQALAEIAVATASRNAVAMESAQNQLAAAMARQHQTHEALRQCQQEKAHAAAMVDILQRQANTQGPSSAVPFPGPHTDSYLSQLSSSAPSLQQSLSPAFSSALKGSRCTPGLQGASFGAPTPSYEDAVNSARAQTAGMFCARAAAAATSAQRSLDLCTTHPVASRNPVEEALVASMNLNALSSSMGIPSNYGAPMYGQAQKQQGPPPPPFSNDSTASLLGMGLIRSPYNLNTTPQQVALMQRQERRLSPPTMSPKRNKKGAAIVDLKGIAPHKPSKVKHLALPSDKDNLSEYQCLLRQQILLFAVDMSDIQCSAQGRNKPIALGQVGVLCRHCSKIPPGMRPAGAAYFPAKLSGLYQASQNMAINHFSKSCQSIPPETKMRLLSLKEKKSSVLGGGKHFWANGARVIGVYETEDGALRFKEDQG